MNLEELKNKPSRIAVGLMSGTSCDGVDAALVEIEGSGPDAVIHLIEFKTFPYNNDLRDQLFSPVKNAAEICSLDFVLGQEIARAALDLVRVAETRGLCVDFIASHGHTVSHLPPTNDCEACGTLQIGQSAQIAEMVKLPVVSDFRPRDLAAGGQGAPLVPYADWVLFKKPDRTLACLNIGGIANLTVVTPALDQVIAFDTGPGNMIIDGTARQLTRGEARMDAGGQGAARGAVIPALLERLLDHPYFGKSPPKSAGQEQFGWEPYLKSRLEAHADCDFDDLLATVTQVVAQSIAGAIKRFVEPHHRMNILVVSGGGAFNPTLINMLQEQLPEIQICRSEESGIPSDAREAVAFALLGNETLCNNPANVPGATGARHAVILGKITPP